jgi:hypothetical protein
MIWKLDITNITSHLKTGHAKLEHFIIKKIVFITTYFYLKRSNLVINFNRTTIWKLFSIGFTNRNLTLCVWFLNGRPFSMFCGLKTGLVCKWLSYAMFRCLFVQKSHSIWKFNFWIFTVLICYFWCLGPAYNYCLVAYEKSQ